MRVRRAKWKEYRNILFATLAAGLFLKLFIIEAYRIPSPSMEETLFAGDFLLVNKLSFGLRTPRYLPFSTVRIPSGSIDLFSGPKRGDVVVFESPAWQEEPPEEPVNFVKRCIAVPGDTISIENGAVIVNDNRLMPPRLAKKRKLIPFPPDYIDPRIYPRGAPYNSDNYGPLPVPKAGQIIPLGTANVAMWEQLIRREGHTVRATNGRVEIDGVVSSSYTVESDYYFMMGDNRRNSLDSRYWGLVPSSHLIGKAMVVYWSWDETSTEDSFLGRLSAVRWERVGTMIR